MKNPGKFINDQLSRWPLACDNFRALKNIEKKELAVGGLKVTLLHNPARIVSSAAKTDPESLKSRKCFLCRENRPEMQIHREFEGRKGKKYDILLNPYPIFSGHLVIAMRKHCPQEIWKRYIDMLDMAKSLHQFSIFYNGPECGASAPDHHHFQAAYRGQMPLEKVVDTLLDGRAGEDCKCRLDYLSSVRDADLFVLDGYLPGIFIIRSATSKSAAKMFYRLLDCSVSPGDPKEPKVNVFAWHAGDEYRSAVVFRSVHRSHHYYSEGEDHLTMSPGCADMAGAVVVPVREDFEKLDERLLSELLEEVSVSRDAEAVIRWKLTRTQPEVSVGIMSAKEIEFEILSDGAGPRKAVWKEGKIEYDGSLYDELYFEEKTLSTMFAEPDFILYGVTIGKGFHWERKEKQKFAGSLKIIVEKDRLTAVNIIGAEDYLVSVISSEMKDTASADFLKAHAVISRSWLLAQIRGRRQMSGTGSLHGAAVTDLPSLVSYMDSVINRDGSTERTIWYDKGEHKNYDICADDHCQRYQGLTRSVGKAAAAAVDATWGEVLVYDGSICDARFSKCCGGIMERFGTCWEDIDHPYLQGKYDFPDGPENSGLPDFSDENNVRAWIETGGEGAFCSENSEETLSQVLNEYDLETKDFFRWNVKYDCMELSVLFEEKSGMHTGPVRALVPLERGASGRISRLKVIGKDAAVTIGKELEIRRTLSSSHLKSSAFVVDYFDRDGNLLPSAYVEDAASGGKDPGVASIVLKGAGWGHGVGLCQIGAAAMASRGYTYREILSHYYPGAEVQSPETDGNRI